MGGREGFTGAANSDDEWRSSYFVRDYAHREESSEAPIDNPSWSNDDLSQPAPDGAEPFVQTAVDGPVEK